MTAQLALLVAAAALLAAPTLGLRFRELVRSPYYVWILCGFGLPGLLRVAGLADVAGADGSDLDAFLRYAPMLLIGGYLGLRNIIYGRLYSGHLLLILVVTIPIVYVVGDFSFMPLVAAAMFLPALAVDRNPINLHVFTQGLAHSAKMVAVGLLFFGLSGSILGACRLDKCSVWGQQIGAIGTGNALGLVVAVLAFGSISSAKSHVWAAITTIATVAIVDLCSSRSGLITWIVAALVAWMLRLTANASDKARVRLSAAAFLGVSAVAIGVAAYTWQPSVFTNRGILWIRAHELVSENPLLGVGPSLWVRQPWTNALVANYSTHNVVLEVLVASGFLGFLALLLAFVYVYRGAATRPRILGLALGAVWAAGGIAEVLSAPGRLYLVPALLPLVFVILNGVRGKVEPMPKMTPLAKPASAMSSVR